MIIYKNPLLKIVTILTIISFTFVFITEWRTWIDIITFAERRRLKRIRNNKRRRFNMKRIICMGILIVSTITFIITINTKIKSEITETKATNEFKEKINIETEEVVVETTDVEEIQQQDEFVNIKQGEDISLIEIPSIGLETVIKESLNKKYLNNFVCHFEDSVFPGEYGNFCLAGHSSYRYNEIFNNLHKIKVGDKIIITTLNNKYEYIVKDTFIVKPEELWVLNQNKTIKEMTIVTCANNGKNRFIVKAELN